CRQERSGLGNFSRANGLGYFATVQEYAIFCTRSFLLWALRRELNVCFARQGFESGFVVKRSILFQGFQRERAVHCATVEIRISEPRRHAPRYRALARTRRAVNGDCKFGHFGSTATLGCVRFSRKKAAQAVAPLLLRIP